jgi:hypothetical protein
MAISPLHSFSEPHKMRKIGIPTEGGEGGRERERERERELKLHVQHYPICGKIYSWKTCWKKIYQGVYGGYLWIV